MRGRLLVVGLALLLVVGCLGVSAPAAAPTCGGKVPTIVGTDDADVLVGTDDDDVILGGGGGDIIWGLDGDDTLCGGWGPDVIHGGAGNDRIIGGGGDDDVRGDEGNDRILGTKGDDYLIGGAGNDRLIGGPGDDLLNGGSGFDRLQAMTGSDTCWNGARKVSCELDGWFRHPQGWAQSNPWPADDWDGPVLVSSPASPIVVTGDPVEFTQAGLSVVAWFTADPLLIGPMQDQGWRAVPAVSMLNIAHDPVDGGGLVGPVPEYEHAAVIDPFGNVVFDDFGLTDVFGWDLQFQVHSKFHPDWHDYLLGLIQRHLDEKPDGYLIDEALGADGFFPDFNPNTLELFTDYLFDTYTAEELAALGEPWGITDFANLDYAAEARAHLPAGLTALSIPDWYRYGGDLPLINQFERFSHLEAQQAGLERLADARAAARRAIGHDIPFCVNAGSPHDPQAQFMLRELDCITSEWQYEWPVEWGLAEDAFPNASALPLVKFVQYFDLPVLVLSQMTMRPGIAARGPSGTVDFYRTLIADAVAAGGRFHIEEDIHGIDQDLAALGPYYRFEQDHPGLFVDVEPMDGQLALLHLWENVATHVYRQPGFFGIANLLAHEGYQFSVVYGAEEFRLWGDDFPEYPAPEIPLDLAELQRYPLAIIPELRTLTLDHADALSQYVEGGGTLVVFSRVGDLRMNTEMQEHPFTSRLLAARGDGSVAVGDGTLVHVDGIWGEDYASDPRPATRAQLTRLLTDLGYSAEVEMSTGAHVGAVAHHGGNHLVVHFVNYDLDVEADRPTVTPQIDVTITLPPGFPTTGLAVEWYVPGEPTVALNAIASAGELQVTVPRITNWGVLSIAG